MQSSRCFSSAQHHRESPSSVGRPSWRCSGCPWAFFCMFCGGRSILQPQQVRLQNTKSKTRHSHLFWCGGVKCWKPLLSKSSATGSHQLQCYSQGVTFYDSEGRVLHSPKKSFPGCSHTVLWAPWCSSKRKQRELFGGDWGTGRRVGHPILLTLGFSSGASRITWSDGQTSWVFCSGPLWMDGLWWSFHLFLILKASALPTSSCLRLWRP